AAIKSFRSDTPEAIFGYLKTVAFNVAVDYFRSAAAAKRGGAVRADPLDTYRESAIPAGENAGPTAQSMERQILLDEIDPHLSEIEVRPAERHIFWLYYRHGMSARAIAAIAGIGLNQKGVESAIRRLTGMVRSWVVGSDVKKTPPGEGRSASNPSSI